jgi:hypothetical protein
VFEQSANQSTNFIHQLKKKIMAKINHGILGPVHGKIGSVVGATWKNIPYLRLPPRKKSKKTQPTPAQIACREKFKFVQEWLLPFFPYVTIGFKNYAFRRTEINAAFSAVYQQATLGAYPNLSIDYSKVVLSKGSLPPLYQVQMQRDAPDTVSLTWQRNYNDNSSFDDHVMLVLYSRDLKITDGFIGGVKRTDMQCRFQLNPKLVGQSLDVYVSAVSLNGKRVSDSEYLGRIAPL